MSKYFPINPAKVSDRYFSPLEVNNVKTLIEIFFFTFEGCMDWNLGRHLNDLFGMGYCRLQLGPSNDSRGQEQTLLDRNDLANLLEGRDVIGQTYGSCHVGIGPSPMDFHRHV